MNYFAQFYRDDYDNNNIKTYIQVVEGIYEVNNIQKARCVGNVNISENRIIKYRKTPYTVIGVGENTITLKKRNYNFASRQVSYEDTYILLQHLLTINGYTQEYIQNIITNINNMSNNTTIKLNYDGFSSWIDF